MANFVWLLLLSIHSAESIKGGCDGFLNSPWIVFISHCRSPHIYGTEPTRPTTPTQQSSTASVDIYDLIEEADEEGSEIDFLEARKCSPMGSTCSLACSDQKPDLLNENGTLLNGTQLQDNEIDACFLKYATNSSSRARAEDARPACTGVLISLKAVLTSSHCIIMSKIKLGFCDLQVVAGATSANKSGNQIRAVDKILSLREPTEPRVGNDLAILILKTPFSKECGIDVILLPLLKDYRPSKGTKCHVFGWGRTSNANREYALTKKLVKVSKTMCRWKTFGAIKKSNKDRTICLNPGAVNMCLGDSGAPMICGQDNFNFVAGIATFMGASTCYTKLQKMYPTILTNVAPYRDKISAILKVGYNQRNGQAKISPRFQALLLCIRIVILAVFAMQ